MRNRIIILLPLLLAPHLAKAVQEKAHLYSNKAGTFSILAYQPWQRNDKLEKTSSNVALGLLYSGVERGKITPTFMVMAVPAGDSSLDAIANATLDAAKRKEPDQGDLGTITKTTIDREPARELNYHLRQAGQMVRFKAMLGKRGSDIYVLQFFCSEQDFAERRVLGDALFAAFHWTQK
jgi:hypothetical protein